ncbi:unnamed protein product [Chrysoparadoxa australica]
MCSGHGQCLSMRQLALLATDSSGDPTPYVYGTHATAASTWEADMLHGCYCDTFRYDEGSGPSYHRLSDYTGYDCSIRKCPYGENPRKGYGAAAPSPAPTPAPTPLFETQRIACDASSGTFTMAFRTETTAALNVATLTISQLETALEGLGTIGDVVVTASTGTAVCAASAGLTVDVQFRTELGTSLPKLRTPTTSNLAGGAASITITKQITGTKTLVECSEHGLCTEATGECSCFEGWGSSDGDRNVGHRQDCGANLVPYGSTPSAIV